MIIKSMARKEGSSFGEVIDYIMRGDACDQDHSLHHNLLGRTRDEIIAEFEENAKLLRKHKGANVMYHEVLSITRPDALSDAAQKEALRQIGDRYVGMRAPGCLVYGGLHDDHDNHLHYHLVISANSLGQSKRHSLTKAQFRKITVGLERRALAKYPKLEQKVSIEKTAEIKLTKKAQAVKARLGHLPRKEAFAADLVGMFRSVSNIAELHAEMSRRDLTFYQRGRFIGVINTQTGKKDRLATLQIVPDYQAMKSKLLAGTPAKTDDKRNASKTANRNKDVAQAATRTEKENDMDLASLLQGVGALADVLSIGGNPQTLTADGDTDQKTRSDASKTQKQAAAKPQKKLRKKSDREIIAERRLAEIEKLRKERKRSRSKTMTRRR